MTTNVGTFDQYRTNCSRCAVNRLCNSPRFFSHWVELGRLGRHRTDRHRGRWDFVLPTDFSDFRPVPLSATSDAGYGREPSGGPKVCWSLGVQPLTKRNTSEHSHHTLRHVSRCLMPASQMAIAQQGVKVGGLQCNVSGGLGLIITSSKEMRCIFTSVSGNQEPYYGAIHKFGLDIGATDNGIFAWDVFASSVGPELGALAGEYVGVDASATVGAGVGANVLVGSQRPFTLQPLSIQAQTGLALAGGVAALTLRPGP